MKRRELEHIIRAAAATTDMRDVVVIGSQAILGSFPHAPPELTQSMEADVFPKDAPERSIVIDGAIGELSMFHQTFGYYAHGVDETTAMLPDGWRERLVRVQTPGTMDAVGWCLDAHDLAVSKLAAGREKDIEFVSAMLRAHLADVEVVQRRLSEIPKLPIARLEALTAQLRAMLRP
jgi:hypothetical protein